jgi:starvation-inducible DNA-binding protein
MTMPTPHRNDQGDRQEIAAALSRLLADSYTLYLKTHGFHWNVVGPRFYQLHKLFEAQYTELQGSVDTIAERIRALGAKAPGSYGEFGKLTSLREESGVPSAQEMIRQLLADHRAVARSAEAAVEAAEARHDVATADLATQRVEIHEKAAWMLDTLLQPAD